MKLHFILGAFLVPILLTAQISDPISGSIPSSSLSYKLKEFVEIRQSDNSIPLTRINMLREAPDNSGRLFVNDLRGQFWVISNGVPSLYINLSDEFDEFMNSPGLGTGFGCFAFHPEFSSNGLFYTSHAENASAGIADFTPIEDDGIFMQWVITEWKSSNVSANQFAGTKREILRFDYPGTIHGAQEISFNPTADEASTDYGKLYICLGDGGSAGRSLNDNLQTTESYLGSIFRIDPLGDDSDNSEYGIPMDNPFHGSGNNDVIQEIYAYGFRNPHRISWDAMGTHKMLSGDIGEKAIEEVNLIQAGNNYGWNEREGTFVYDRSSSKTGVFVLPSNDNTLGFTYPVAQYDHDEGFAIVGGYVYRGEKHTDLKGQYIFGDISKGKIFHAAESDLTLGSQATISELRLFNENGNSTSLLKELDHSRADLRFGVDDENELYILTKVDGKIRTLERMGDFTDPLSSELSQLIIYPNPGNGVFTILNNRSNLSISVYAMSGILVEDFTKLETTQKELDLSHLTSGVYTVRILHGQSEHIQKIVID